MKNALKLHRRIASEALHKSLTNEKHSIPGKREDFPVVVPTSEGDALVLMHLLGRAIAEPSNLSDKALTQMKTIAAIHDISIDIVKGTEMTVDEFSLAADRALRTGLFYMPIDEKPTTSN